MKDIIGKCHHVIVFPTQVDVTLPKLTEQRYNATERLQAGMNQGGVARYMGEGGGGGCRAAINRLWVRYNTTYQGQVDRAR